MSYETLWFSSKSKSYFFIILFSIALKQRQYHDNDKFICSITDFSTLYQISEIFLSIVISFKGSDEYNNLSWSSNNSEAHATAFFNSILSSMSF